MIPRLLLLVTFACWIALLLGTHLPSSQIPKSLGAQDKLLHAGAYAVLTTFVVLTWRTMPRPIVRFSIGLAIVLSLLHAGLDEATQYFVPGRSAEIGDWLADGVGVLIGVAVAEGLLRFVGPAWFGASSQTEG